MASTALRRRAQPKSGIYTVGPFRSVKTDLWGSLFYGSALGGTLRFSASPVPLPVFRQFPLSRLIEILFRTLTAARNTLSRQERSSVMEANGDILSFQKMSVLAVRFYAMLVREVTRVTKAIMGGLRDRFEVCRIAACAVLAFVVDVKSFGDVPVEHSIYDPMDSLVSTVRANHSVAILTLVCWKIPASVRVVRNAREKPLLQCLAVAAKAFCRHTGKIYQYGYAGNCI